MTIQIDQETTLRDEIDGLRRAMETRATIEQAKGIVMFVYQIDEARAFAVLRRWSLDSNIKLRDLAAALIQVCVEGDAAQGAGDEVRAAVRRALATSGGSRTHTVLREA